MYRFYDKKVVTCNPHCHDWEMWKLVVTLEFLDVIKDFEFLKVFLFYLKSSCWISNDGPVAKCWVYISSVDCSNPFRETDCDLSKNKLATFLYENSNMLTLTIRFLKNLKHIKNEALYKNNWFFSRSIKNFIYLEIAFFIKACEKFRASTRKKFFWKNKKI